jgi:ribosomal subunit interface protein
MHMEFKLHQVNPQELLISYVERRLHFALSRFGDRVGKVTTRIRLSDASTTGEIMCRISADLRPFGAVLAEATDADVYTAIDRCVARLARRCDSKCTRSRGAQSSRTSIRTSKLFPAA